jgi:metal-responsive CopG/Arc/MetJ family transcriptional regulator
MTARQRRSDQGREGEVVRTTIRVPSSLMERIDELINDDEIALSKNVWILQALREKAERDEEKRKRRKG